MNRGSGNVTSLLRAWRAGDATAGERLLEVLYRELHGMAHARLALERQGTLQTTALVHECYLRLVDQRGVEWRDRGHFRALPASWNWRRPPATERRVEPPRARAGPLGRRRVRPLRLERASDGTLVAPPS
jgi:hypothetical protein